MVKFAIDYVVFVSVTVFSIVGDSKLEADFVALCASSPNLVTVIDAAVGRLMGDVSRGGRLEVGWLTQARQVLISNRFLQYQLLQLAARFFIISHL